MEAYMLRRATAANIVKVLQRDFFPRYGKNLLLISDNGSEFQNRLFKNVNQQFGNNIYFGTAYNPQSLAVERSHRDLNAKIRTLLQEKELAKEKWHLVLGEALLSLRNSPNNFGSTPFQRVYGKFPNQVAKSDPYSELEPIKYQITNIENNEKEITFKDPETHKEHKRIVKEVNPQTFIDSEVLIAANIEELDPQEEEQITHDRNKINTHLKNKQRFDNSRFFRPIEGELVDRYAEQDPDSIDNRKLARTWIGPFKVIKVTNFAADLADYLTGKITKNVHLNRLRASLIFGQEHRKKVRKRLQELTTNILKIERLNEHAQLPRQGSEDAVGFDLYSLERHEIPAQSQITVGTGIAVTPPAGCYVRIAPRSSLALRGIAVGAGVIDPDYTGEIKVVLFNHSNQNVVLKKQSAIAQAICERAAFPRCAEVSKLAETVRNSKGFGSTTQA